MTFFFYFLIGCLFLLTVYRLLFVIASLFYSPPQQKELGKKFHMAFFVPCKNEEKNIKNTLDNLFSLSLPEEVIDIYVYDDASIDNTKELILSYKKGNLFPIFNTGESEGKASALAKFLKKALSKNYNYIFVIDADHTLDKKALSNIIKYFSDFVKTFL